MLPTPKTFAHWDAPGARGHLLEDHLRAVGERAAEFAALFGSADWGRVAGTWHDLGKYRPAFQYILRQAQGEDAHLEREGTSARVDHSSPGAIYAQDQLGGTGLPLALVIAGHHTGLKNRVDWNGGRDSRYDRAKREHLLEEVPLVAIPGDIAHVPALAVPVFLRGPEIALSKRKVEFWIRMLFSALVDADFLDTEAFFDLRRTELRQGFPSLDSLAERLRRHLEDLTVRAVPSPVNQVRGEVLARCQQMAAEPPGIFSLTVPTGGGKTFAALAFALAHARAYGLHRVIVAAPFLTIIDQTVDAYYRALSDSGDLPFIEHHSGIEPEHEHARNRLAVENWDAPLVVTTAVQLLESLFARRTSHCRKLHNLARSVIVLDEAQTLPVDFRIPIVEVLQTLADDYGATIVLCTATQPELRERRASDGTTVAGFRSIREIAGERAGIENHFRTLRRVRQERAHTKDWDQIAALVAEEPRALAITHLRADARELVARVEALRPGEPMFHLSALMCARHRRERIAEVRVALASPGPVRVVSTQLVEAGVDLDFPTVFRALAGFDSLIQSAGRCNREGKLAQGRLVIFDAPTRPPVGLLRTAADQADTEFTANPDLDLFAPDTYRNFERKLWSGGAKGDKRGIQQLREQLAFEDVADKFKLIDDAWRAGIIVPWAEAPALLADAELATEPGHLRSLSRKLQGYSVEIPRRAADAWLAAGVLRVVAETFLTLTPPYLRIYDSAFGLLVTPDLPMADPEALIG